MLWLRSVVVVVVVGFVVVAVVSVAGFDVGLCVVGIVGKGLVVGGCDNGASGLSLTKETSRATKQHNNCAVVPLRTIRRVSKQNLNKLSEMGINKSAHRHNPRDVLNPYFAYDANEGRKQTLNDKS
jgi:hypothetical protein